MGDCLSGYFVVYLTIGKFLFFNAVGVSGKTGSMSMAMASMQTTIHSLALDTPLMNAAGVWCTTTDELQAVAAGDTGAVVTKSMTLNPREGNICPRYAADTVCSVNSMGLPNHGVEYYCGGAAALQKSRKPIIASIAGFREEEYSTLLERVCREPFDAVEINLSCPNVEGKEIFAYDLEAASRILERLRAMTDKLLGVKLPPYSRRSEISAVGQRLVDLGINFVTVVNSYPLGTIIDAQTRRLQIVPNGGIGGLGGKALKPIALSHVLLFSQACQGKVAIIGAGGVETGTDVAEYLLAGASAVQVGTALYTEGPSIFERLTSELTQYCDKNGISRIADIIGTVASASSV